MPGDGVLRLRIQADHAALPVPRDVLTGITRDELNAVIRVDWGRDGTT